MTGRRFIYFLSCLGLALQLLTNCTSMRPRYTEPVQVERNQVLAYQEPYFVEKLNVWGWSVNVAVSAGVGYAVYHYLPEKAGLPSLSYEQNRLIAGAGSALVVGTLYYLLSPDGNRHPIEKLGAEAWLGKLDDDQIFISYGMSADKAVLRGIHKDSDKYFIIGSLDDAVFFNRYFPSNRYSDTVLTNSAPGLGRDLIPPVIGALRTITALDILKQAYYDKSTNLDQLLQAAKLFPQLRNMNFRKITAKIDSLSDIVKLNGEIGLGENRPELEKIAYSMVNRMADCKTFTNLFPGSDRIPDIEKNALNNVKSLQDIENYLNYFPDFNHAGLDDRGLDYVNGLPALKYYAKIFAGNPKIDTAINRLAPQLSKDELKDMIRSFPFSGSSKLVKNEYIRKCSTVNELIDASQSFEDLYDPSAEKAAQLCSSLEDIRNYLNYFGDSEYGRDIKLKYDNAIINKVENLGSNINTGNDEYLAVISPDGETLYFVRNGGSDSYGGEDIYFSVKSGFDSWNKAENIRDPLNNKYPNGVNSVTPDGNYLLLHNLYHSTGNGLSLSAKTADGWSFPTDLDIPGFYTYSMYHNGCLSSEGNVMIISLCKNKKLGTNDLFVSFRRKDGKWTEPKSLGRTINTEKEESDPFLASDGVTLYFSSNGHQGVGKRDIFMSRRIGNSWTNWSKPVNLGPTINTTKDENFYTIPASGEFAYFSSNNQSLGGWDIFRIGLPLDKRPNPVVLLSGKVIDTKTGEPLNALVKYEDLKTGEEIGTAHTNPANGMYKIVLPGGRQYGFRAEINGFVSVNQNLDLMGLKSYKNKTADLYLVPIESGQSFTINNLFFDAGKATVRPESYPELSRLLKILKDNKNLKIAITGYTNNSGNEAADLALSENRANAVRKYYVSKGISESRMTVIGMGPKNPVAPDDTEENRQKNRRVEVRFN